MSKRLCQIIGEHRPAGIVIGGGVADFKQHFPQDKDFKSGLYRISLMMHLVEIGHLMDEYCPNDRVSVYYDRSREFGSVAREAFDAFMSEPDPEIKRLSRYFVTMAPMGWEDCVPLQPADFLVYEAMKRLDGSLQGNDDIRKSLQALIGAKTPMKILGYTPDTYQGLLQMSNNTLEGKPLAEGVTAGFEVLL